VTALQRETGLKTETPACERLLGAVARGEWGACLSGLAGMEIAPSLRSQIGEWVAERRYFECVAAGRLEDALAMLNRDMAATNINRCVYMFSRYDLPSYHIMS
jgi:hypothetical protein